MGWSVFGATQSGRMPTVGTLQRQELERIQWMRLDIASADEVSGVVSTVQPELVFHLAAQSSVGDSFADPLGTWNTNATGTFHLVVALRALKRPSRLLFVSSAEVYGPVPEGEQPIREVRALSPRSPYAASKAAAEMVTIQGASGGALDVVVARSFNHTGQGQDTRFALPSFAGQLRKTARGNRAPILQVGNLEVWRDFLDVRDVVRAYVLLARCGENRGVYNVASGEAIRLRSLVEDLVALSGTCARIEVDPDRIRPVEVPRLQGDSGRLRALGWTPRIPIREMLASLLTQPTHA